MTILESSYDIMMHQALILSHTGAGVLYFCVDCKLVGRISAYLCAYLLADAKQVG